ncbi:MAG: serine/threonine protein kinase, partial [Bryobacterales bacterium]|nr:serine/threonine protein kinase [Bryobacterales bacterium]
MAVRAIGGWRAVKADLAARVEQTLGMLLDLPAGARMGRAMEEAGEDEELREALREALRRLEEAERFFSRLEPPARVARRVGPYEIREELGRGGMGSVHRAERVDGEFRREVAIKFMSLFAGAAELRSRFQEEKRILAALQHPHIAQLLDAGTTEEGVPYLVMELVEGTPVDVWSKAPGLSMEARLAVFQQVCEAVAYIHRNLVVHRDVKPNNILVTADGTPKLLDFGVSKMMAATGNSDVTAADRRLLTLNWASPEQLSGSAISTSSDVYSLGLVLHAMLTGRRAYDVEGLGLEETIEVVCRREVAVRGTGSADLDAIVGKALRKDPADRYLTVRDLAADVERARSGHPVLARPPSFRYQVSRFVRRNRLASISAAAALVAIVGGLVGFAWQARVAKRERAVAQMRFEQVRRLANGMLTELHDQIAQVGGSVEARKLLVSQSLQYLEALRAQAADDAALQVELASGYRRLGEIQGSDNFNLGDREAALRSLGQARQMLTPMTSREAKLELVRVLVAECGVHNYHRDGKANRASAEAALRLSEDLLGRYPHGAEERIARASALRNAAFAMPGKTLAMLRESRELLVQLREEQPAREELGMSLMQREHDVGSHL